jgi:catechol 2,3-dioxygenase-like lactoylglutathione lyase family enzyme
VFDHVTIRVSDREASERFYRTVLSAIGSEPTHAGPEFAEWDDFSLTQASDDRPATKRLHVAFVAPSHEGVDAFWRAGTEGGYEDDGKPGPRPQYRRDYYGAFLLDPDGNSIEAVHHGAMHGGGIDHLWFRVANVAASRRFYERVAPHTGFELSRAAPDQVQFVGRESSFTLRQGRPTENVHMAFPAEDNTAVEAFHQAATSAGYRDCGRPGERPQYHAGYYGAYVLDPDGHNVELVNHNRVSEIRPLRRQ